MSTNNKALMSYYIEGSIISRELEQMMHNYAADARFERELAEDHELYRERKLNAPYGGS